MGERFTRAQALALVGQRLATVVRADAGEGGYTVGIQWELPGRAQPLVDWFTRVELTRYLRPLADTAQSPSPGSASPARYP